MSNGCDSCEVLYVNGVKTHEFGCPAAWKDEVRSCKWCGNDFTPEERHQEVCSDDTCREAYYG